LLDRLSKALSPKKNNKENSGQRSASISRRDFLRLSVLLPAMTFVACSRDNSESSTETTEKSLADINIEKARSLYHEVGIETTFIDSSPQEMFELSDRISQDMELDTKLWRIFTDQNGDELGMALDDDGEVIALRKTPSGEVVSVKGLNFELSDIDAPQLVHQYISQSGQIFAVISYGNSEVENFIALHPAEMNAVLEVVFAHSTAPRNILHFPDDGMPTQVFQFSDTDDQAYQMPTDQLPDSSVSGTSVIRYAIDSGEPSRADIFLSAARIMKESSLLGLPFHASFSGYLANEAYGIALDTYRLTNHLPALTGKHEAASSGADWATAISVANNAPNAFFTPTLTTFIEQLSQLIVK
jgi:hypothetical protein